MKRRKFALFTLICTFVLSTVLGLAACGSGDAKRAIELYTFSETYITGDFTLPKTIGNDVSVKWKSDKTDVIAIEDAGDEYEAKVTLPDEVTDVKLTISAGGESKDFTVQVAALSVFTFKDSYVFPKKNMAVKEGFSVPTTITIQGKSATITWEVPTEYASYLRLVNGDNGNKNVEIEMPEDLTAVELKATFQYGTGEGSTVTQRYAFSVSPTLEDRQILNRMYSIEDYPLELSGYIVHVYEASESFGNATFYMVSDDFQSGYYLFRIKINADDVAKYVAGAHVTVTGDRTKNYNGLWENNSGGTATVDETAPIDPREHIYDLDTDAIAGAPSMLWHESTLVKLSGWKVKSVAAKAAGDKTATLFTLTKQDAEIDVAFSTYVKRTGDEKTALLGLQDTVKADEYYDVVGLLGCYNGRFQLQPITASDVNKVNAEAENTDGAKVKAAVAAVKEKVDANFGKKFITKHTEVTMPTTVDGVTISYRIPGTPANPTLSIGNDGKFTIEPSQYEKNYDVEVTYSIGTYKAYEFFKVHNWAKTDAEIIDLVHDALAKVRIANVKAMGTVNLQQIDDTYGATITWAVKEGTYDWLEVTAATGAVKVKQLPAEDTTVTFVATITSGSATAKTVEISVNFKTAPAFTSLSAPASGKYKLVLVNAGTQDKAGTWYATGKMDSYYFGTTDDYTKAADFTITQIGNANQYTIKVGGKFLEIIPRTDGSEGVNIALQEEQTEGKYWQWVDGIKNFVMESTYNKGKNPDATDVDLYYLGTYGNNYKMSGNYIGRIATKSGDEYTANNKEGTSQWVAHYGTLATK